MRGSATFTTVASSTIISWATSTIAMPAAARPACGGSSAGSSVVVTLRSAGRWWMT